MVVTVITLQNDEATFSGSIRLKNKGRSAALEEKLAGLARAGIGSILAYLLHYEKFHGTGFTWRSKDPELSHVRTTSQLRRWYLGTLETPVKLAKYCPTAAKQRERRAAQRKAA